MKEILDAIQSTDSTSADFAALPIPDSYRAVTVHKDEVEMFAGLETREKDPASPSMSRTCRFPNSGRARPWWR